MPTLTQETITRRDAAMASPTAFSQASSKRSIYERVLGKDNSNAEARIGLMQERLMMQQSQNEFQQRMSEKESAIHESIAQFNQRMAEQKLDDTHKVVNDAIGFLEETSTLKPGDPFFNEAVVAARKKYPDSLRNDEINARVKAMYDNHATVLKAQQEEQKLKSAEAFARQNKLVPEQITEGGRVFKAPAEPTVTLESGVDELGKPTSVRTTRGPASQMPAITPVSPDELFNRLGIIPKPGLKPLPAGVTGAVGG